LKEIRFASTEVESWQCVALGVFCTPRLSIIARFELLVPFFSLAPFAVARRFAKAENPWAAWATAIVDLSDWCYSSSVPRLTRALFIRTVSEILAISILSFPKQVLKIRKKTRGFLIISPDEGMSRRVILKIPSVKKENLNEIQSKC
jgi:hypothetical protein